MANIEINISGIQEKGNKLLTVKSKFEESNQKMTNLVNDIKNNHMNDFSGRGPDQYINSLGSYSQNLKKMNSVLEILGNSTLKSAEVLKEAQENVAKKLFHASISTTASGAAQGSFVNSDSVYKPSFKNVDFKPMGNGTYKIVNQDGVELGFTTEEGKASYEATTSQNVGQSENLTEQAYPNSTEGMGQASEQSTTTQETTQNTTSSVDTTTKESSTNVNRMSADEYIEKYGSNTTQETTQSTANNTTTSSSNSNTQPNWTLPTADELAQQEADKRAAFTQRWGQNN